MEKLSELGLQGVFVCFFLYCFSLGNGRKRREEGQSVK